MAYPKSVYEAQKTNIKFGGVTKLLLYLYEKKDYMSYGNLKVLFGNDADKELNMLEEHKCVLFINDLTTSEKLYSITCTGQDVIEQWILKKR